MTTKVITVRPESSVAAAIHLFVQHRFRHLLVVSDAGRLVGVLSDRDALRRMAQGGDPRSVNVGEVMKRDPLTAMRETDIGEAIDQLRERRINCLPVIDGEGVVVGILTTTDLLGRLRALLGPSEHRA